MPLLLGLIAVALLQAAPARAVLAPTGTLRASFIASNPVQGRVDPKTGETTGPGPDLVRELARRLGVDARVLPLPDAAAVLNSVRTGTVDIGFLATDPERAAQVDFSDGYSSSGAAYAVRADSPFQTSADVDRAGVTIGAFSGQAPEVYVREHMKQATVTSLPSVPPNAVVGRMLLDGKVQAWAANRTRMEELARAVPGLRVLADVRPSGFMKQLLDRANVAGVRVAPEPR